MMVLIDSGAYTNVCPRSFAPASPLQQVQEVRPALSADGRPLRKWGARSVVLELEDGETLKATYQVMNVSKAILIVAELRRGGWGCNFPDELTEPATLTRGGR
eukprot:5934194-Heterocapsa_arctica.AAC.1